MLDVDAMQSVQLRIRGIEDTISKGASYLKVATKKGLELQPEGEPIGLWVAAGKDPCNQSNGFQI